jgi:hypothetical protein
MLRILVLACACAAALGHARPVISLSLDASAGVHKLPHSVLRVHDLGISQPDGTSVGSRQDYVQRCQVVKSGKKDCPLPQAKAFDHQDGKLAIKARVFQIDADGTSMNKELKSFDEITYNKRSTYHLKYDAADQSGNNAEQIVFGLIIEDTIKPVIKPCVAGTENVEAASDWKLCDNTKATDNVDGNVAKTLRYTISYKGEKICPKCTYVRAAASISTLKLGTYKVTAYAHDNARMYGHNGHNNQAKMDFTVVVKDTLPPKITPIGANPATHECATVYSDEGAIAKDKYDNKIGKKITVVPKSSVDNAKIGTYTVTYNANDSQNNVALQRTRTVGVIDTTKPKIWLKGGRRVEHVSETAFSDPGVNCADSCSKYTVKPPVWEKPFTDTALADYIRTYTCVDAVGNKASVRRTFTVVDTKAPILKLVGAASMTVEAGSKYTEPGATCHDYVDKNLTPKIVYSGKVNGGKVGVYTITYNCADESGNAAPFIQRRVFVKDRTCPNIKVTGSTAVTIEAGFSYKDQGATASDSFDGDLTSKITTDGDTVDTNKAFLAKKSCQEIKANYKDATSGRYFITTKGGKRNAVWCDMASKKAGTFMPCDKCKRVVPYSTAQGDCGKFGMKMADFASKGHKLSVAKQVKTHFTEPKEEESKYFPTNPKATTNFYVCVLRDEPKFAVSHTVKHDKIAHAEQGKYIIKYHVRDAAGNSECTDASRVVIVRDTLAPVISLLYKGKLIHNSGAKNKGVNGQYNPAATAAGNPYIQEIGLQEEQATSGSSLLSFAAVSFAVGVAMLAFTGNNGKAATVPV